jgi:competence protein ComEA
VDDETLRDRLASLSRRELVGLALIVGVTLAGGALWYVRSLPGRVDVRELRSGAVAAPAPAPTLSASPVEVLVHVAGWVRRPGVYRFDPGDRVVDAIRRAGGARPGASLEALNLAAPLADGAQVVVIRGNARGSVATPEPTGAASGAVAAGPINLNTADASQLESLPGIGEVLSQAIIDYRTDNGPFATVDELEAVSGIGPTTLENVRDLVTV